MRPPSLWPFVIVLALAGSSPRGPEPVTSAMASPFAAVPAEPMGERGAPTRSDVLPGPFPASVVNVVDGDTVEARVTIWLGQEIVTRVRLRGIDAPELYAECADERRRAQDSREALHALIAGRVVILADVGLDKYGGRVLAALRLATGEDIGRAMIASGHARPYHGGRREPWCANLRKLR